MKRGYSRFAHLEEKRNLRKALGFLFLTGVTIVVLFFFGIPIVVKFAAFLTEIKKPSTPIEKTDTIPPAPPQLKNLPEATNEISLTLEGTSESGATVLVFFNDEEIELVANDEGTFTAELKLVAGENTLSTQAKDKDGNESQKTQAFRVIFDNEPPSLEIASPADGAEFFGSKNQKVAIRGSTEPEVSLTINDRIVKVEEDGSFDFRFTLAEGENILAIKSVDKAGNLTEQQLTLKFSP